jgi:hypothetical protein
MKKEKEKEQKKKKKEKENVPMEHNFRNEESKL